MDNILAPGTTHIVRTTRTTLLYILLVGVGLAMAGPFLWMIVTSLSSPSETYSYPPSLPTTWHFENYTELFNRLPFGTFTWNSFKISLLATLGTLVSSSLGAYAFARMEFRGKKVLYRIILATMMIPFQVTMIPIFFLLKTLGLYGSQAALILPSWFGFGMGAFGIFLLRGFFSSIPREMEEAARMDGAGRFRIFWSVMLPLSRPALATLAVVTFMAHWNDLIGPVLYLTDTNQMTLTIGMASLQGGDLIARIDLVMAGAIVSVLPIILLFIICQRFFIQGIMTGGIKA